MRKIEKPTIKHKNVVEEANKAPMKQEADSPYGVINDVFPECKGKLLYAWEHEVADEDNFRHLTGFFINDAMGGRIYFRTNSRATAQSLSDCMFGQGKYRVNIAIKAAVR